MKKINTISIQIITWILLVLGFFITLFCAYKNLYFVNLKLETTQNIAGVIIEASGAFIGFVVIYLTISFENYKKIYGQYASSFFGRNNLIRDFLIAFILPIVGGLTYYIFSDTENFVSKWLFNFTCYTFFVTIGILLPYAKAIIKNSSSNKSTKDLVLELNISDFVEQENVSLRNVSIFEASQQAETRRPNMISNILFANIQERNGKNSIVILIDLFEKIKSILNDKGVQYQQKQNVALYYAGVIKNSFDLYHYSKDSLGVKTCLAASNSLNSTISENNFDEEFVKIVFELVIYITKSLIESESESLMSDAISVYYQMSKEQLANNTPDEDSMWDKNDKEWIKTINTEEAKNFDKKFRKIEEYVSYEFNEIVERSFLCKNYQITENCVSMLANFSKMVFKNTSIGPNQKNRIGSMLSYHSSEAIKQFSNSKKPFNHGYLNLFLDIYSIVSVLKSNQIYSEKPFDEYLELVKFLFSNKKLSQYEIDSLGDLCCNIISNNSKIPTISVYVDKILNIQKNIIEWNVNHPNKDSEKIISDIKKRIKYYLTVMKFENVNDSNLINLIGKCI